MNKAVTRPEAMKPAATHYCPGCGHGVIHRLICEIIDEMQLRERTVAVAPVGCAVLAYDYWNFDTTEAAHGRTPAVATGIKRVLPDHLVFTYQGDGDLAAIGTAEIIHAGNRGENISVIFVNNGVYGMTGGQMAPTSLIGQKTTTTPGSRQAQRDGFPIRILEMMALMPGVVYLERTAVHLPKDIMKAKRAIKRSFEIQLAGKGFSMVEILAACPTHWGLSPIDSVDHIEQKITKEYPLGVIKDVTKS